ncbi:MAG: hypothetical protein JWM27_4541 [Gemmatimonadetes bacterium]|nr:hypothetical protein [Gemmatimonadota bacterium]
MRTPIRRVPLLLACALAAGCTPRDYHRDAQRPVAADRDALKCSAERLRGLGYTVRENEPTEHELWAKRLIVRERGARYDRFDSIQLRLRGGGAARTLLASAATLEGGEGGVAPRWRAPSPRAVADADAVLAACT